MLTDDEIKAIEAERDRLIAERLTAHNGGQPMMRFLSGPVPALLADRRELVALARELVEALLDDASVDHCTAAENDYEGCGICGSVSREWAEQCCTAKALAKARAAGLLEGDRG